MVDGVPMAGPLVWPHVVRERIPLVYLDINHYIDLARTITSHTQAPAGYGRLLDAAERAVREERALFPLSAELLYENLVIKDPKQRRRNADVMEALSGFGYLLGRPEIAQLEVEAGIEDALGEDSLLPRVPLIGRSFGWAFGMVGGMKIVNEQGGDASAVTRQEMGAAKYEALMQCANYAVERAMLNGPSDDQIDDLRPMATRPSRRIG